MKSIPQHRKVYEKLRRDISEGIYPEGSLLPSENEICAKFKITRATVRKALDTLLNEGYIKKHQGKGSIVQEQPQGIGILSITGTTSAIGKEHLKTKLIVKPELRKLEEAFSFKFSEKEKKAGCLYFERLRHVDNKPVFYEITIVPNINLPYFTSINLEDKSLFDILRKRYHIKIKGGEQKIKATTADVKVQKYFKVKAGYPILQISRKIETNRVDYFFYSQVFCNTSNYVLFGTF